MMWGISDFTFLDIANLIRVQVCAELWKYVVSLVFRLGTESFMCFSHMWRSSLVTSSWSQWCVLSAGPTWRPCRLCLRHRRASKRRFDVRSVKADSLLTEESFKMDVWRSQSDQGCFFIYFGSQPSYVFLEISRDLLAAPFHHFWTSTFPY